MKKRTVFILLLVVVALFGFFSVRFLQLYGDTFIKLAPIKKVRVSMKIYLWKDVKTLVNDDVSVPANWTALDLLKSYNTVAMKGEGINAYVTTIDTHKADDSRNEFWAFYVNGKQASVGAGSYILRAGDKIEWKIEKY